MTTPWLHVVGIGEDGLDGLSASARSLVLSAEVLIGGKRHHAMVPDHAGERLSWPTPFDAMPKCIADRKGKRVVALVTGDPLWYSAGEHLSASLSKDEVAFHPQVSAFQLAASRMGWSLADVECLTVHGRAPERIVPALAPEAKLLVLGSDAGTPATLGRLLVERGYGRSEMTVLAHMGGQGEEQVRNLACDWTGDVPGFHTLAIQCVADENAEVLSRTPGLPDTAFDHDGKLTKQEVRAATLAKLCPRPAAILWDVGLGCGSVAIEWMRAARGTHALGIEPRADRRSMAAANALKLGVPDLEIVEGTAPEALDGLAPPDAVFIGGGLSEETFDWCWAALKPHGRLVANTVTLESEAVLLALAGKHGGDLVRISVDRASPVGSMHGWRPHMPVMQWSLSK